MPLEVSRVWLWTAQNAFLSETNPATGQRWKDRHGLSFGKHGKRAGNIEPDLNYKKLIRSGKLLRGLKAKRTKVVGGIAVELYNNTPYASFHEVGGVDPTNRVKKLKGAYVTPDVDGAVVGGDIHARPSMQPSKQVLKSPERLTRNHIKSLGW